MLFDLASWPPNFRKMFEEQLSEDTRNILGLQLPTDPRWVDLAGKSIEEILTDHAYCEQKAATSCISLIQRYSEREKLVKELSPIVTEEWGHFRLVLQELEKRNLKLGKQRKDEYVNKLIEFQKQGGSVEGRMLDQLLTMALVEARSCERFKRLSEGLNDEYLQNFYLPLIHYKLLKFQHKPLSCQRPVRISQKPASPKYLSGYAKKLHA